MRSLGRAAMFALAFCAVGGSASAQPVTPEKLKEVYRDQRSKVRQYYAEYTIRQVIVVTDLRVWKDSPTAAPLAEDHTLAMRGQSPELEVALYEYGKSSLTEDSGYLRQIVPLTDDLDKLSEELFSLETNGGSEHCGQVTDAAVQGLAWSKSHSVLSQSNGTSSTSSRPSKAAGGRSGWPTTAVSCAQFPR